MASPSEQVDFLYFLYFFDERSGKADDRGTIKHYPHEIIMSRRKSRNGRKNFAGVCNYNFCYFLYFCGTIKYYPHEIIMSRRKSRNSRKGFASGG